MKSYLTNMLVACVASLPLSWGTSSPVVHENSAMYSNGQYMIFLTFTLLYYIHYLYITFPTHNLRLRSSPALR